MNKSSYGPLPIAILVQSVDVFDSSPVNRVRARQHHVCPFGMEEKAQNGIFILSDSAVYTPEDGDNLMFAKLNLQITDLGYSQIVEHLGKVNII